MSPLSWKDVPSPLYPDAEILRYLEPAREEVERKLLGKGGGGDQVQPVTHSVPQAQVLHNTTYRSGSHKPKLTENINGL
jgi:hypothetical protein